MSGMRQSLFVKNNIWQSVLLSFGIFFLSALAGGCKGGAGEENDSSVFKVGLLSPGPVNSQGWAQIAYQALLKIEKELGAQISYVEVEQSPALFERAFRDYASQGYQMVLGHGFEFQDAALAVAKDFPDTWFFISSSKIHEGNVVGVDSDSSEPFYLMGIVAAKMGRGAGLIGGVEIPPITNAFIGFINGVRSVNPDFPVSTTYLGSWTDAAAAKEAALSMIAEGADFIIPDADAAGSGVYQALNETGPGYWSFGIYNDFTSQAPNNMMGNYFNDYGQGLVNIARQVRAGNFKTQTNIEFGLKDKDVIWVEFVEGRAPAEVLESVDKAIEDIIAGKINTLAPIR